MIEDDLLYGTKFYSKKFREIVKPLADYIGINEAVYTNIDSNGRMFYLTTNVGWGELLVDKKYYLSNAMLIHPDYITEGFSLSKNTADESLKLFLYEIGAKFDMHNTWIYSRKSANGKNCCSFGFSTSKYNILLHSRLINESLPIKKMIFKIEKTLYNLLGSSLEDRKINFAELKGESFYEQKGLRYEKMECRKNRLLKFAEDNYPDDVSYFSKLSLSAQEINCLRLYSLYRSVRNVSHELKLTVSTTSSYINNIKHKLNCRNKNDLFERAQVLESFSII